MIRMMHGSRRNRRRPNGSPSRVRAYPGPADHCGAAGSGPRPTALRTRCNPQRAGQRSGRAGRRGGPQPASHIQPVPRPSHSTNAEPVPSAVPEPRPPTSRPQPRPYWPTSHSRPPNSFSNSWLPATSLNAARHPLANSETVEFQDLLDEPFVAAGDQTGAWREHWLAAEERGGYPPSGSAPSPAVPTSGSQRWPVAAWRWPPGIGGPFLLPPGRSVPSVRGGFHRAG